MKERPDHHDAELVLKLYDLRREALMREARAAMNSQFWPKSFDDVQAVLKPEHPFNAFYRQTSTYWEMAYSFARHSIVNPDFLAENAGEGILLYAKMLPFVEQLRAEYAPHSFLNTEWLVQSSETAKARLAVMRKRVEAKTAATK